MRKLYYILPGLLIGVLLSSLFESQREQSVETRLPEEVSVPPPLAQVTSPALLAPLVIGQEPRATVSNWQMTGISSSVPVTVTVPVSTRFIEIQAEDQNLRWRSDGTAPLSGVGNILFAGTSREFWSSLSDIQLIATTGVAKANLFATKYKQD